MAFDGRMNIVEIDDDEKVVIFDTWKPKKITGHRIGGIFGYSEFSTPFKVACEIAGLYPGDKANKYIDAGNVIEPILREYARKKIAEINSGLGIEGAVIEEPAPPEQCQYDHFHNEKLFGGMVDGYVTVNGKRTAILEIKTSSMKEKWIDDKGGYTNIPMSYMMQASLYAHLSKLDKLVFVVGFLEEADYRVPSKWIPSEDNTLIIIKDCLEMNNYLKEAEEWYKEYILTGCTPEWTDKDEELLKYLRAGKNKKRK